ncbi:4'-phosphopantetheinyl transferase superfamily protein [Bdellovibrio bacteriovorus]
MTLSKSVIESLQNMLHDSDLRVYCDSTWGSDNPEHRALIQHSLNDLKLSKDQHISISHCQGAGIFVVSRFPIGVDVEVKERVTEKVVARISTAEELSNAPSFSSLWCAKEATFKALKTYQQPSVVSAITVGDWQKIDSQVETFKLMNSANFNSPSENRGVCVHTERHSYSFFIFLS